MSNVKNTPFVIDLEKIRTKAREHMSEGAVTQSYQGDKDTVLKLLNAALATENVSPFR